MSVATPDSPQALRSQVETRVVLNKTEALPLSSAEDIEAAARAKQIVEASKGKPKTALEKFGMGETPPVALPDKATSEAAIVKNLGPENTQQERDWVFRAFAEGKDGDLLATEGLTQAYLIGPIAKVMRDMGADNIINEINNDPEGPTKGWIKFLRKLDEGREQGKPGNFIDTFNTQYASVINKDRAGSRIDNLARERGRLMERQGEKDQEYQDIEKKLAANKAKQEGYKRTTKTSLGGKLAKAEKDVVAGAEAHATEQINLGQLESALARRENALQAAMQSGQPPYIIESIQGEIGKLEEPVAQKKLDMEPYEKTVREKDGMVQEREGLSAERDRLWGRQTALTTEIEGLRQQITALEGQISEGGKTKEEFEKEFSEIAEKAFTDAMRHRLANERQGIIDHYKELEDQERDPHIKAALKACRESANVYGEWEEKLRLKKGLIPFGHKEVKTFNKDAAEGHLRILEREGPEAFVISFMVGRINPTQLTPEERAVWEKGGDEAVIRRFHPRAFEDPANVDAIWHERVMYKPAELTKLTQDKEFMDKAGPKAVGLLLRQAVQHNLLNKAHMERLAEQLSETEWGQEALDSAIKVNKETKEAVEKAEKSLGGKFVDFFKKRGLWRNLVLMLMFGAFGPIVWEGIVTPAHAAGA